MLRVPLFFAALQVRSNNSKQCAAQPANLLFPHRHSGTRAKNYILYTKTCPEAVYSGRPYATLGAGPMLDPMSSALGQLAKPGLQVRWMEPSFLQIYAGALHYVHGGSQTRVTSYL